VEFMALADSGEAELVYCDTPGCSYAANVEAADAIPVLHTYNGIAEKPVEGLTKVHTPIEGSISALAKFLNIPEDATVKALSGKDADGQVYVLFIPGDHELNPLKAEHAFNGFDLLSDDEMLAAELVKGFMGPVGLPAGVKVVADESLRNIEQWVVGANEPDYHYIGATLNKDFKVDTWADLIQAKPGDMCPKCAAAGHAGAALKGARGIEVGQVFQLGTKYSDAMGATYMAEDGSEQPYIMGCYGWGVTRSLAAVVEQYHDDNGIIWPVPICPAAVCVIPLNTGDDLVEPTAQRIAQELADKGIETALDDRAERAGVKFNDADLIGWPYQVVCGKRGLQNGIVELKCRATGEKQDVPLDNIVDVVATALRR
jgi:prolyl-tRNA synthetase